MASKDELCVEITALVGAAGGDVASLELGQKNHQELTEILKGLKAESAPKNPTPEVKTKGVTVHRVVKGCAVTSLRGIRADGAEVEASDFPGKDTLQDLVKRGLVEAVEE